MKKPNKQNSQQQQQQAQASQGGRPSAKDSRVAVKEAGGEPTARSAPMPVLLIGVLFALMYWGSMYIVEFGGQADARVQGPYRSFKEIDGLQPKGEFEVMMAKGALVYKNICSGCHQNDGSGSASQNAPPLAGSEWVSPKDPSRIIRIVLHGLSGPITVKGKEWGAGQMLAFKDVLTDEDIANALSYVRNSWGNKAPIVKADQVKKTRAETAEHNGYMTVPDLMKVTLKE